MSRYGRRRNCEVSTIDMYYVDIIFGVALPAWSPDGGLARALVGVAHEGGGIVRVVLSV
jgi:hypothetical protein